MHIFSTRFSGVVRFRVLVPRIRPLNSFVRRHVTLRGLRPLGTELMCLPRQLSTGRQTGGLHALEAYLRSITHIFVATRLGLYSGDCFRWGLVTRRRQYERG